VIVLRTSLLYYVHVISVVQ